jgi:hypothetical protein
MPKKKAPLDTTPSTDAAPPSKSRIDYAKLRRDYPSVRFWVSPSAIELFWLCKRRWAFKVIERLPDPQRSSAALGELFHGERERWLTHGTPPSKTRAGDLAKVGLEYLPPPGRALVERVMAMPTLWGWGYAGLIDFFVANLDPAALWGHQNVPLVGDHKSTSAETFVKDEETLATKDPQGIMYAAAGFLASPPYVTEVDLHWSYAIKSNPPRPRQVRVRVSRGQVAKTLPIIHDTAYEMLTTKEAQGIRANDVAANPLACEAFGAPCPYKDKCSVSPQDRFRAALQQASAPYVPAQHPGGATR